MIRSIDAQKAFDKIQSTYMIKTLSKLRIEGNFLHMTEIIHRKSVLDNISNDKKTELFLPKIRIKAKMSFLPLLYIIMLFSVQKIS